MKYHYLTERIFAKCGVYFLPKTRKQAKYEIEMLLREYEREMNRGAE